MKYCSFCGCYIPDNWDNCPACGKRNYTPELIYYNKPIDIDVNKTLYGKSDLAQAILNNERICPYYNGPYPSSKLIRIDYMNELYKSYKMEKDNDN